LREVLQRIGWLEAPENIPVIAGEPWHYRNRIQFQIDGQKVGYHEAGSHNVVDTSECPVASSKLNEALRALRRMVRHHRFPRFVRSIECFTNEKDIQINVIETLGGQRVAKAFFQWCEEEIPGAASGPIDYPANGHTFRVHFRSFFQVNRFLIEPLTAAALGDAKGESAMELYAGVGLFSLSLADRFRRVEAVESVKTAAEDLEVNARRAKKDIIVNRGSADLVLEGVANPPEFLLADPPRAGLGPTVVRELIRLKPKRIALVSCDPATLARDLKGLCENGYRIGEMTLLDMFPQTFHLETVTHLHLQL
jgi:23S rRNA (uracil1939-C5)-methyltransferase